MSSDISTSTRDFARTDEVEGEILTATAEVETGIIIGEKSRRYGEDPFYSVYWDSRADKEDFVSSVRADERMSSEVTAELYNGRLASRPHEKTEWVLNEKFPYRSADIDLGCIKIKESEREWSELVLEEPLNSIRVAFESPRAGTVMSYVDGAVEDAEYEAAEEAVEEIVSKLDRHVFDWYEESRI